MDGRAALPWLLLGLCALGFAGLGLPDGIIGIAWPQMRSTYSLPLDAVGALLLSVTLGYVVSSFASGPILARWSVGGLLSLSCAATALSLYGYSISPWWSALVALGTLAGLGAGAIDAGINAFVARHYSARVLSLLHAFYGFGTAAGPAIMTAVLVSGESWRSGYRVVAAVQLFLAVAFAATYRLWPTTKVDGGHDAAPPLTATLRAEGVVLSILTFFLYVGVEACINVWTYSLLSARGIPMATAGLAVTLYWGALLGGRLLFALVPLSTPVSATLRTCMTGLVIAAAVLSSAVDKVTDLTAVAVLGLAAGPIFPALMASTPHRFHARHVANTVGFQVAGAALGQAWLPAALGTLADGFGVRIIAPALLTLALLLMAVFQKIERVAPIRGTGGGREGNRVGLAAEMRGPPHG